MRDFHLEFHGVYDCLFKTLSSPVMLIYATPPPFGQELFDQIMKIMTQIKNQSQANVELVPIEGTHHFHMLKPAETAQIVLKFLDGKVYVKLYRIFLNTQIDLKFFYYKNSLT